ncbi:MAG: hypothetical protein ABI613_11390 [Gemmatimonadota bacterium]
MIAFVRLAIVASFVIAIVTRSAGAQSGESPDSTSLTQLRPSRFVRFAVPNLGRVQGRVDGPVSGSVTLTSQGQTQTISLGAIDTLWVRGRATRTGAIIGAIAGLGGGLLFGALLDALCEYDCGSNATVTVGALGAITGAGAGAIVGAAIPRWKKVFSRRR